MEKRMGRVFVLKYLLMVLLILLGILNKTSKQSIAPTNNTDTLSEKHISYLIKAGVSLSETK